MIKLLFILIASLFLVTGLGAQDQEDQGSSADVGLSAPANQEKAPITPSEPDVAELEEQAETLVTPSQDKFLRSLDLSERKFKRLQIGETVTYFHRRKIGEAIVEKDFLRYQVDSKSGKVLEEAKQWRDNLPDTVTPRISKEQAESMVEGNVQFTQLYIISPESDVFPIKPTPTNPCWVVRSVVDEELYPGGKHIVTIIDAVTGAKLGYGLPPPSSGLSIHGPDSGACPQDAIWDDFAENAESQFEDMGYSTEKRGNASNARVQGHIQSDSTAMFFELNHGGSSSFHNRCDSDITAADIESWIADYASMPFTFIGSCRGMCDQTDDHFSHEFRKGLNVDTVVIGYCGMSDAQCSDCWTDAEDWQDELFDRMNRGQSAGYAFSRANAAFPDCAGTNNCMRFAGDPNLVFAGQRFPKVARSFCGAINDHSGISPLYSVEDTLHTRAHHVRCNSSVPVNEILTVVTTEAHPYAEIVFLSDAILTANGTLNMNGRKGQITIVSVHPRDTGIRLRGELKAGSGGQVKVYE